MKPSIRLGVLAVLGLLAIAPVAQAAAGKKRPSAPRVGIVTVSPLAGTPTAQPGTQISFLGAPASAFVTVSVRGSVSGRHLGRLASYRSLVGSSFLPRKPFNPGERVSVVAKLRTSRGTRTLTTSFTVAIVRSVSLATFTAAKGTAADVQSFQSRPDLHPPVVTVTTAAAAGVAPGYVLATPAFGPGQYGPMIFDNAGNMVWFHPVSGTADAANLQLQRYLGRPVLTWWQGETTRFGYGLGENLIYDSSYHRVADVRTGNGLQGDEHDFVITPQGAVFTLAYSPVTASLAAAGGPASGIVLDTVAQEIDIRTGLVMWEWHSLGHVGVEQSVSPLPADSTNPYDYFHMNSLQDDGHGHLLMSARNTSTIYDIDERTGAIIWQLGGKRSTFTLGAGVPFALQHHARLLANGNISLFDDEGAPPVHPPTRGEVIKLNFAAKTATLVEQFVHAPPLLTGSQGSLQPLPNGDWFMGWGGLPQITEFNAQGQMVFDAHLPLDGGIFFPPTPANPNPKPTPGENSYRAFRAVWNGQPTDRPAIKATTASGKTTVFVSWNGATRVARWLLLTGSSTRTLKHAATAARSGFETTISASAATVVQVRALDSRGRTLGSSNAIRPRS